nr:hypothetical protein [Tanacetum cinerariifolium]
PLLEVNTPRSDEDRLKLMELMVFVMKKDVCSEFKLNAARLSKFLLSGKYAAQGFEQIIDFLSGSYIHHALTVNPHVYISYIKQFWHTAMVKRSGDLTRLQALVDKKRIVISEEVIHEILQLNDAEGVVCLLNEEIFAGLARMGYEKPSTKLTFYKAFFSTKWKFFIHTILHSLSQRFNFSKYIFESLVRNVDSTSKFYMYPRVGKGFSGVETPLFENMLAVKAVDAEEEVQVSAQDDVVQEHVIEEITTEVVPPTPTSPSPSSHVLDKCSALVLRVEGLKNANAAQKLEIVKLKARVKKLERLNKVKSSKLRRLKKEDTEVQEAVEVVTTPKPITEVVTAAATQVVAASAPIPAANPKTLKIAAVAPAVSTRRRKGVVIRDPEEELHTDTPAETPTMKDKGKRILIEDPKPMKKKD